MFECVNSMSLNWVIVGVETTRNICHAIGPGTIEQTTAHRWFDRFRKGNQSLQDNPKPDRPNTIDLKQLKTLRATLH